MRLLLDTHTALWWRSADERLSAAADDGVCDPANEVLLSAVVLWEIAIKRSLGKLDSPPPLDIAAKYIAAGARRLPITLEHAAGVERLEWHHRDPFDRLLVAQAMVEGAVLVTGDAAFRPYGVPTVW